MILRRTRESLAINPYFMTAMSGEFKPANNPLALKTLANIATDAFLMGDEVPHAGLRHFVIHDLPWAEGVRAEVSGVELSSFVLLDRLKLNLQNAEHPSKLDIIYGARFGEDSLGLHAVLNTPVSNADLIFHPTEITAKASSELPILAESFFDSLAIYGFDREEPEEISEV